jgi:hypothetical protein
MCGKSSIEHGGGVKRTGPTRPYGPTRSLHTGSSSILSPLLLPSCLLVSIKKLACPIHVALRPSCFTSKSGLRTFGRPARSAGTGTKFLGVVQRVLRSVGRPELLYDGHGFLKPVGGLPLWCAVV